MTDKAERVDPDIDSHGAYLDLGGLWVRYDAIGTIKAVSAADGPYCQVVLTIPGYKTLGVGCEDLTLLRAIGRVAAHAEMEIGKYRARGMRGES